MEEVALSVVICTCNRPEQLERCLLGFEAAIPPGEPWEIIVVVNDTGKRSIAVVEAVARRGRLPLTYSVEPKPGLSSARNHGIARARGQILAFTDDDCLIAENWMSAILSEFASDPELSVLGGRVDLADPQTLPIAIRPFADRVRISAFPELMRRLIGCNMAMRRHIFARVGTFDIRLGSGGRLSGGDDLDFLYRALKAGMKVCYSPDVQIRHAHGRTGGDAVVRLKDGYVKGRGAFYAKHARQGDGVIMKHAFWELTGLLRSLFAETAGTDFPAGRALRLLVVGAISELWVRS